MSHCFSGYGACDYQTGRCTCSPGGKVIATPFENPENYKKHRKNCEGCPTKVTWKVKFKCQICLPCLSRALIILSVLCLMCPGYPVCLICPVCPGCPV